MAASSDDASPTRRREHLEQAQRRLAAAERQAPRRVAEWLLMEVLDCDQGQLYAHSERPVPAEAAARFSAMVQRCVAGEPVQHVLGYTVFRGLRIEVSPAVMVPRPETEEVAGAALEAIGAVDAPRVLDVGTGSGCIALAVKHERPDAVVAGWDVSPEALAVARRNADRLALDVQFEAVDLFSEAGTRVDARVDLLVSNPPYIPDEEADTLSATVREYDPPEALFSGDDALRFYRALADRAPMLCVPGGALVLEAHADHAEAAANVLRRGGLTAVRVDTDLSDRPRILTARVPE
jgi:release factor glutamine methyltransferase